MNHPPFIPPNIQRSALAADIGSTMEEAALLSELRELEVELHRPTARGSRERLEELLHPDFTEVGRSGRCYTRDAIIKRLLAEDERPDVWSGEFNALSLDQSTALLTYRSAHLGPGGELANSARRASIWSRGATGWQLVHHQGTPEPSDPEQLSTAELDATVVRMEARLSSLPKAGTAHLLKLYAQLVLRFEQDLGTSPRDVALARSAALMLVQAFAATEGAS
ncbi:MAG: DUF4440 domain-containing protein [Rhodoferax sp.]|uniref:nuclear transport factor 2 family protein n=1 Tax=Rhodoferax sp. TaxID=50421 RepID=UPI00260C4744|nr:DUF4440 domain-containing protein [Rhodoferax sp.]MDD5332295.1 DUF4440 domain-containing protein [Rhodoferax sp.]